MKRKFTIATIVILASAIFCRADVVDNAQAKQITNTAPQTVKAYKSLNFEDDTKTVVHKLTEIVGGQQTLDKGNIQPMQYSEIFWRSHKSYGSIIYGAPSAVFASKQILGFHMNNYLESIEVKDQAQKAKSKKELESSTGF